MSVSTSVGRQVLMVGVDSTSTWPTVGGKAF